MDRFAQILYDLSKEINVDLYPDQNRICQINYEDEIHLQIQYEESKERIFLASFVCDIPPGKYREKLLRAALVSNHEYPHRGTFSYSEKNNQLTLVEYIAAPNLTGEKLFKILKEFIEKAKTWKDAVEKGTPLPIKPSKRGGDTMFGMKP